MSEKNLEMVAVELTKLIVEYTSQDQTREGFTEFKNNHGQYILDTYKRILKEITLP